MEKDTILQLLDKEYFHLQTQIEKFDDKSLTIKAWSVTLVVSIAGSSAFTKNYMVLLFAAIASLMFWIIDASWKNFQYCNYKRIREIEDFMKKGKGEIHPLQITKNWSKSYREGGLKRFFRMLLWRHVVFPHGAMFILLTLLFFILNK